jgi:hypothetical protein
LSHIHKIKKAKAMWRCPHCSEQIDDTFDVCWKCGTMLDGTTSTDFHAASEDSDLLEGADPKPVLPSREPDEAMPFDARNEQIVELCSTDNIMEAQILCDTLQEAGIRADIVGTMLGNAAGALPFGESVPRIWVRKQDVARACEIANAWMEATEAKKDEEAAEADENPTEEDEKTPFQLRSWCSLALTFLGAACIAIGVVWAGYTWLTTHQLTAMAEGEAVDYYRRDSVTHSAPAEFPLPQESWFLSSWYEVRYAFKVQNQTYYATVQTTQKVDSQIIVYYDPQDPTKNIAGRQISPWRILSLTFGLGGFGLLIGYYLNRKFSDETP